MKPLDLCIVLLLSLAVGVPALYAEEPPKAPETPAEESPEKAPAQGAEEEKQPTPEEVIEELERLRKRRDNEPIEPTPARPAPQAPEAAPQPAAPGVDDPVTPRSGVAPDAIRGKSAGYRDGQTILARRGRLLPASEGSSEWMLAFDADSAGLDDPPLYLMPCRELEAMEKIAGERGTHVEFVVTGEVFLYRGHAYLLPRITRAAVNNGNLQR